MFTLSLQTNLLFVFFNFLLEDFFFLLQIMSFNVKFCIRQIKLDT